jgi:5-methylcytosine-specific restriction endonuclease McrA
MSILKEQILKLRSQGLSYDAIASELDCSKASISYHCNPDFRQRRLDKNNENRRKNPTKRSVEKKVSRLLQKIRDFKREGRYARCKTEDSDITTQSVMNKFSGNQTCYLTGRKVTLDEPDSYNLDHKIPRAKGGRNTLTNLGILCPEANRAKHDMTIDEFLVFCKEVLEHNGFTVTQNSKGE